MKSWLNYALIFASTRRLLVQVDVLEEEAQWVDGQTGRKQGNTVCQSFFLCTGIDRC